MALVSVWITTYNHENFIAQAIEGVLMQQTNFSYEIIIGEDCSTDCTRQIVIEYKKKYPDLIKLFLPEKNIGMTPMFKATYSLCSGRYIAWLDGDDFWTDPLKLQKQVDFLEENQEYVLCFHKVKVLDQIKNSSWVSADPYRNLDNTLTVEHFLRIENPVDAPSVLHRNVLGHQLPEWLFALPYQDLGFYFLLMQYGKVKYFEDVMCVYRIHKGGAWSGNYVYKQYSQMISFYQLLLPNLRYLYSNREYSSKINSMLCLLNFDLMGMDLEANNFKQAKKRLRSISTNIFTIARHRKKRSIKIIGNLFLKILHLKSSTKPITN